MAFLLSPGISIQEQDLTNVVPAVATSIGGFVGVFKWGPVLSITTVDSQNSLYNQFEGPDDVTATSWFSAANFLDYTSNLKLVRVVGSAAKNSTSDGTGILIKNIEDYESNFKGGIHTATFAAKYPGSLGNSIKVSIADSSTFATWAYKTLFTGAPTNSSELHVVVIDKDGAVSGVANTVLEKFAYLSKASDAKKSDGTTSYYVNVLERQSKYVWQLAHPTGTTNWGKKTAAVVSFDSIPVDSNTTLPIDTFNLSGGTSSNDTIADADLITGWNLFANSEQVDVNLLFTGEASATVSNYVIQNVAESRLDCIAFASPSKDVAVNNLTAIDDIIAWRQDANFNVNSSYGALDSGWKYQYDRYNDTYRWIPLSADVAGLHARTDDTNDAWWAAGGLVRGQIKNCVKLSVNPGKTDRDKLYQAGINPVVTFPGEGTVLYGNKTLLTKPSAFDRINVRRLFIVLEKAIATAAKYQIFEFNDDYSRSVFISMVSPFLRLVQGRRGITKFKVVCDASNNTPDVVARNEFRATIAVIPNYVSEFVYLTFAASNNTAMFTEQG